MAKLVRNSEKLLRLFEQTYFDLDLWFQLVLLFLAAVLVAVAFADPEPQFVGVGVGAPYVARAPLGYAYGAYPAYGRVVYGWTLASWMQRALYL